VISDSGEGDGQVIRVKRQLAGFCLLFSLVAPGELMARQPVYGALYGGGTAFDVDYQFAGELDFDPEEDGDTFGIGVGYEITDHWFVQLDYTHTDADDVDIDQVFLSLNYQLPLFIDNMKGMIGIVAGEGTLDWSDQPDFADAIFDDLKDDESLYGIQLGLSYDIADHWSTSLTYQYFDQDFNTNVETPEDGRLEFEHSSHHYVLFGLRFHL
jgi:opacity protein-like surface antigen